MRLLRELVQKSLYVVDERAVAAAIILRARTIALLPEPTSGEAPAAVKCDRSAATATRFRSG